MVNRSSKNIKKGSGENIHPVIPVNDKIQVKKTREQLSKEQNKNINYSFFYKRILCRHCGKASFDKNFLDNYGNYRQYGINFCKYHMEMNVL